MVFSSFATLQSKGMVPWPTLPTTKSHIRLRQMLRTSLIHVILLCSISLMPCASKPCSSDLDCSLNGQCVDRRAEEDKRTNSTHDGFDSTAECVCDKPWSGEYCEKLLFLPTKGKNPINSTNQRNTISSMLAPQGYGMTPNRTTWGGSILVEPINTTFTKYHLYVSRMTNDCPLEHWHTNSRIDHAVSINNIHGPYEFSEVAIPTFSHNPAPIILTNVTRGRFAIFHIGDANAGPNGGVDCRASTPTRQNHSHSWTTQRYLKSKTSKGIHVSDSFDGPWTPVLDHNLKNCNNPAPWAHPSNGTLFVLCAHSGKSSVLFRSLYGAIEGPYDFVTEFEPFSKTNSSIQTQYEDPFLYTDSNENFHVLYHAYQYAGSPDQCDHTVVSAHAFSRDGYDWHVSPVPPYASQIQVSFDNDETTTTSSATLATRERPKLVIQNGILTHLVEGVCGSSGCPNTGHGHANFCVDCKYLNWDFTLVSTLDRT